MRADMSGVEQECGVVLFDLMLSLLLLTLVTVLILPSLHMAVRVHTQAQEQERLLRAYDSASIYLGRYFNSLDSHRFKLLPIVSPDKGKITLTTIDSSCALIPTARTGRSISLCTLGQKLCTGHEWNHILAVTLSESFELKASPGNISSSCIELELSSNQLFSAEEFVQLVQVIYPIEQKFSLFQDPQGSLRYTSYNADTTKENQPLSDGIQDLSFKLIQHHDQQIYEIQLAIKISDRTTSTSSHTHHLGRLDNIQLLPYIIKERR